jgi:hypothetical protein
MVWICSNLDVMMQWKETALKPYMVDHTCDPSTQKAEAEGATVLGWSELHNKTLSLKKKKEKKKGWRETSLSHIVKNQIHNTGV